MVLQRAIPPTGVSLVEYQKLEEDYEKLLSWADLVIRAMRNPKFSPHNFRMFIAFIERYPQMLTAIGQQQEIEVGLVRGDAGNMSESSGTRFFGDMDADEVFSYTSDFDKVAGRRRSLVTPREKILYPETFDTNSVARKKKARQAEEKRRNQFKDPRQMLQCPECGSNHILWDATPRCEDCHTVYPTRKDIPGDQIIIEAELIEAADGFSDWLNEVTEPRSAVRGVQVTQATLSALAPASAPASAPALPPYPDQPCVHCRRPQRVCFALGPDGKWDFTCTPDMWGKHAS